MFPAAPGVRVGSDSALPDGNRFIGVFKQKNWLSAICMSSIFGVMCTLSMYKTLMWLESSEIFLLHFGMGGYMCQSLNIKRRAGRSVLHKIGIKLLVLSEKFQLGNLLSLI